MFKPPPIADPVEADDAPASRWAISALLSMVLHLGAVLALGLVFATAPRGGTAVERTAEVGIVLKHQEADGPRFEGAEEAGTSASDATARPDASPTTLAETLSGAPPIDPTAALPAARPLLGLGALEGGAIGAARGIPGGHSGAGGMGLSGGKARTGVFGVEGEGYKFVYVFDRSGSMGGSGRNALSAAKAELLASLRSLESTHQFQIIFYNDRLLKFNPSGNPDRLVFATEQNKAAAERFLATVEADGGTNHELALSAALKLQPDVVFFLTDADEPKLYPHQLAKIHRLAGGVTINAIEFGYGPQQDADNFLVRLARENGGRHGYVDISRITGADDRER